MENEFIKTYDDFLTENTCNDLIKTIEDKSERVDRNRKPNFYQRNIGDLPEYAGLYEKFKVLGMDYISELG